MVAIQQFHDYRLTSSIAKPQLVIFMELKPLFSLYKSVDIPDWIIECNEQQYQQGITWVLWVKCYIGGF